jgi:type I restriction enzyme, S subunit
MGVLKSIQPSKKYPESWELVPFIEAVEDLTGGNPKINQNQYLDTGLFPVIDQGKNEIAGYVNDERLLCKAPLPCIIFGDHTKIFKRIDSPFVLGADGVKVLKPKKNFDINFIYYYFKLIHLPNNVGYSRHFKFLKEYEIPKPPIEVQKRIAHILDTADALRQKRQQTIELADQFLRSVFLDMFGDPVNNPKGWNKRLLDEIIQVQSGQVDPKVSPYCNLPHVGGDNIISGSGKLLNVKLAKELNLKSGKYAFDESFILYSKIRPILNKVASPNFSGICSADIYPIRPKAKTVSKYFLEAVLKSKDFLKYCEKVSTRTNIPKINRSDLLSYSAPIPTYIEGSQQSQFEDLAKNISIIKEKLFQSYEHSISLFNSLTQRAFRGEL